MNPTTIDTSYANTKSERLVVMGDGRLLVNTQGVAASLNASGDRDKKLSTIAVGKILGQLSKGMTRPRDGGRRVRYHEINTDHVFDFATGDAQIGNEIVMRENLQRPLPESFLDGDE
jgi:hypothetical protein